MMIESVIREQMRQAYREEGVFDFRRYPAYSQERLVALSECQRIRFEEEFDFEEEHGNQL